MCCISGPHRSVYPAGYVASPYAGSFVKLYVGSHDPGMPPLAGSARLMNGTMLNSMLLTDAQKNRTRPHTQTQVTIVATAAAGLDQGMRRAGPYSLNKADAAHQAPAIPFGGS